MVPRHLPALPAYQLTLPSGAAVTVRTQLLGPMGLSEHQLALLRRHVPAPISEGQGPGVSGAGGWGWGFRV